MNSLSIIQDTLAEAQQIIVDRDYWIGSIFETLATRGTPDDAGKWGEKTIWKLITTTTDLDAKWNGDKNTQTDDGIYDIWIKRNAGGKKTRIEVKTSRFGVSGSWQHENLIKEKDKWDKLVLVDFEYLTIWITILNHSDMVFDDKHPIFGTTPCLRDNKKSKMRTDKYKWDFRPLQIQRGVASGLTFCYDVKEPDDEALSQFLKEKLDA